ncbi:MAG: VCBS repeat-containing protein [Armatimonadota bacterium]|nr:MAG: VCBS repeat-containing protein [Armatimonadota bacterium]
MRSDCRRYLVALAVTLAATVAPTPGNASPALTGRPQYESNPFVIQTMQPPADERQGGIAVADLDGDGLMDFLYTTPGSVGAYHHDGRRMWLLDVPIRLSGQSESEGLPGLHHPGVQAADIDGDGATEVVFLLADGTVQAVDGGTGNTKLSARPPVFGEVERWESFILCNLRRKGDRDIVLQATNPKGYRVGHYLQAMKLDDLDGEPLWRRDDFGALAHGPARAADLDGDGRDEIIGFTIVRPDGTSPAWRYPPIAKDIVDGASFHIDSLFVYDVRPDVPGLEVVLLEEGRNYIAVLNPDNGVLWHKPGPRRQEPQNAAVGDFDPSRPGLEIWCRSRHNVNQTPWVMDARGKAIAKWKMAEKAPPNWTDAGVEEISVIDWDGSGPRYCAAKERHARGDICIFNPATGDFVRRWSEQADRIMVADVAGDWREEIIVVRGNQIRVYWNPAPNPHAPRERYWTEQHYRRSKTNWNYYSP